MHLFWKLHLARKQRRRITMLDVHQMIDDRCQVDVIVPNQGKKSYVVHIKIECKAFSVNDTN